MEISEAILKQKEIRITPIRQLLLNFFLEKKQALGLIELEKAMPRADRITLYRTLKTFEEKGILHSILDGTSTLKYALCPDHCSPEIHLDNHPHFYCVNCKTTECLETVLVEMPTLPKGYRTQKITLTIEGICSRCD